MRPVTLEGATIRLEPLELEHLDRLWTAAAHAELWRWTVASIASRADLERYVREALDERGAGTALPFVTVIKATNEIAGSTRFGSYSERHRRVEIGWTWLASAWQWTRVNTESKYLMLRYAFEELGLVRVELKTDALNRQSRAAIERIGAREEGILRSHFITEGGRFRDTVYYSILATEWPDVRQKLESMLARERR